MEGDEDDEDDVRRRCYEGNRQERIKAFFCSIRLEIPFFTATRAISFS